MEPHRQLVHRGIPREKRGESIEHWPYARTKNSLIGVTNAFKSHWGRNRGCPASRHMDQEEAQGISTWWNKYPATWDGASLPEYRHLPQQSLAPRDREVTQKKGATTWGENYTLKIMWPPSRDTVEWSIPVGSLQYGMHFSKQGNSHNTGTTSTWE